MKYIYPAVFSREDNAYNVTFPDLPGVFTCGYGVIEAYENAADALNLMLWSYEYDGIEFSKASSIEDIHKPKDGFVSYVMADTEAYSEVIIRENPGKQFDLSRIRKAV